MTVENVLITGASSGIGLELAKLFAADKSNLILVARSADKLNALADSLRQQHGIVAGVLVKDLAAPEAPQELFDKLKRDGVTADVLVNNAGFGRRGPIAEVPLSLQLDMIQVNVTALTALTRLFLPGMLARNRGGILNVGSTAGFEPGPNMGVYYATKAYVLHYTEALAEEVRGTNLKVSCLAPGPTHTGFADAAGMRSARLFKLGAMSAAAVAKIGHRGFRRGKVVNVAGWRNWLLVESVRFAPRFLVRKITKSLQE
ncbi:MAG: SDR family NAD(P)-dependent oxidoreductase [Gemmataceae bacterium]